jgi:hypothetical protein
MDFSIRKAAEKMNALFEEIDEFYRKALPTVFRKLERPAEQYLKQSSEADKGSGCVNTPNEGRINIANAAGRGCDN